MHYPTAHYVFTKTPLPSEVDGQLRDLATHISKTATSRRDAIWQAYDHITRRHQSSRIKTITRVHEAWARDWRELWNRTAFLHCTNQNYLLAALLVHSGLFVEDDIRLRWTQIWLVSPHQYLQIQLEDGSFIDVDSWGRHYNIPFGQHASGFRASTRRRFVE